MESDEFYDSLEEDSVYDEIDNERHLTKLLEEPPDNIIPFYDKDLSRSEINLSKTSSKCSAILSGKKTVHKSTKRCFVNDNDGKLKSNSYLTLFHARAGNGTKSPGRSRTARSNLTSKTFVNCEKLDVDSFYLKSEETSDSSLDNHSTLRENPELFLPIPNAELKYQNTPSKKSGQPKRKCRSPQTITTKIPELGRLGPDIPTDKLELLRRRQQYGKRVSQSNRIKMIEKKALQNIQQEMKNSRICI